jgi:hypothetical protein
MIQRLEAQAGAVHMRVLRTLFRRDLCKFVSEFHQRSSQRDGPAILLNQTPKFGSQGKRRRAREYDGDDDGPPHQATRQLINPPGCP